MKKLVHFYCLSLFLISSCQLGSSETWKNNNIPDDISSVIDSLNYQVVKTIKNGVTNEFKKMCSPLLLKISDIPKLVEIFDPFKDILKNDSFQLIDSYYTKNKSKGLTNLLTGSNYTFGYIALNKKMYVSILEVQSNTNSSYLIGLIYGKYGANWKLNVIQVGQNKWDKKDAIAFFQKSKKQYLKKHFVDSANSIFLAKQMLRPLKDYWTYDSEKEILELIDSRIEEIKENFEFPIEIQEIKTKPKILSINPQLFVEGVYPIVNYKSMIDLKDTISLKKEYLILRESVVTKFKGLDKENKAILFRAWEEIPDGKTLYENYTFLYKQ